MIDGGLAFVIAILAFTIQFIVQGKVDHNIEARTYRAYRVLIHGGFLLLVVFFVVGNRVVWTNCLTGFAWRAWLLLYTLPAWITTAVLTKSVGP